MIARALPVPTDPVVDAALLAAAAVTPHSTAVPPIRTGLQSGAALTEFLIAELADDSDVGAADEERFARAVGRVESAMESLQHVAVQLRARVHSSSSLPLPFDPPVDAPLPPARLGAVGLAA